jgi:DNA-binding response OmpR family regulator
MDSTDSPQPLADQLILLVEDEPLIALDMEDILRRAGARVLCVGTLTAALQVARRTDVSAAVLDYRISGRTIEPVCAILESRGAPFILTTGDVQANTNGYPTLSKPVAQKELVDALRRALRVD